MYPFIFLILKSRTTAAMPTTTAQAAPTEIYKKSFDDPVGPGLVGMAEMTMLTVVEAMMPFRVAATKSVSVPEAGPAAKVTDEPVSEPSFPKVALESAHE
jgi:hypothetical protein